MRQILVVTSAVLLGACAGGQAIRTSQNTIMVSAGAAPACGPEGAARVAAHTAAIETIRAGYTSYIISAGQASNNSRVTQAPGQVHTQGTVTYGGGYGTYQQRSTYVPGPTIVSGRHSQALAVTMFNPGDAGAEQAVDARQVLGPDWQEKVRNGIRTCL